VTRLVASGCALDGDVPESKSPGQGVVGRVGEWLRGWQNGYVRTYGATMLGGLGVVAAVVLALTTGSAS